jgi:hypothetical protein
MQIHEITKHPLEEGFFSNVGKGFVQGVTGVDVSRASPNTDPTALATANQRTVITVSQPGQTVPAKYYKTGNSWTNELGTAITDPKQTAYLEKLIPTHGKKETIPAPLQPRTVSRRRVPK